MRVVRLFLLGASLFVCGTAFTRQATNSAGPALSQQISRPDAPPGVDILKVKWDTFVTTEAPASGVPATAQTNQNRLPVPGQNISAAVQRTTMYVYSMELRNSGPKAIKALAWDFIFTDAANNTELARHSLAALEKINLNQKKTIEFRTAKSPPKRVSAAALEKNKLAPFAQNATVLCLMFFDTSVWEHPKSKGACDDLQQWIARKQKAPRGAEDLPLKD